MNPREKILIGTIVGLALVVVAGFITNFTLTDHTSTQNQIPATPIVDIQEPTLSPKLEYAAITDSASQKSPLTVLFKKVEKNVLF